MGQLAEWRKQNWVRIGTDGSIKGPCGTSKDKKTQIGVYQQLKQEVYLNQKEQQLQEKRNELVQKVKQ